jgi:glucose/mannose-6-phosphate isomerase
LTRKSGKSRKAVESILSSTSKIDKSNLKEDYDLWPDLARTSWSESQPPQLDRSYSSMLLVGMGGSGIIGEVISDLSAELDGIRIDVLKDYHLPRFYSSDTLVVGISASGDTEETISVMNEASKKGLDICTFGSGGLLEKLSQSNQRIRFTKSKMLKVPRSSFPGLFYPVLKFLTQNGYLKVSDDHVVDSIECLSRARDLCSKPLVKQNKALEIALEVAQTKNSLPVIYSSKRTRSVGLRFRQSLNENSKTHAFEGTIPEICHNDIVSWDYGRASKVKSFVSNSVPIALKLEDDPLEVRTRFQIVEDVLRKSKSKFIEAQSIGTSYMSRVISMMYILEFSTYYAAILRGVDPILTPSIELLKDELRTRLNYLGRFN